MRPAERNRFLHDLYLRQLKQAASAKYVRSFRMRNAAGITDYYLFYAANSPLGLKKMKEAMWKVDVSGEFTSWAIISRRIQEDGSMWLEDHFGSGSMLQRNERVKLAASFWNNIGVRYGHWRHGGGILNRHCDSRTCAWLALLLDRQQHFDLYAHHARSAPLGQRTLQMVQLGNLAKPRTDRAELFAKSCRRKRQDGFS